jgi:hypothetical protein
MLTRLLGWQVCLGYIANLNQPYVKRRVDRGNEWHIL